MRTEKIGEIILRVVWGELHRIKRVGETIDFQSAGEAMDFEHNEVKKAIFDLTKSMMIEATANEGYYKITLLGDSLCKSGIADKEMLDLLNGSITYFRGYKGDLFRLK